MTPVFFQKPKMIRIIFMATPPESLGEGGVHEVMGKLAIARNIIDGLVLDIRDLQTGSPE